MSSPRWLAVLWFSLIVGTWVARGLPWNLDEFDQAKQAYTSYEMVGSGEWWFQHTPRQASATKPPLVGWMSAATYFATRSWEVAWRLPSLLAAVGIWILLWKSGRQLAGVAGAILVTGAFSWNILTLRLATMVRTDMVLAFFIFAAGWLIWRHLQNEERWTWRDTAWLTFLLGAATMTKGPIYHAFLLPGLIAWAAFSGPGENKARIFTGYVVASLLSVLPFLLWTWLLKRHDPEAFEQVVGREFLGRFTIGKNAVHNNQTWYFYLPHLIKLVPWSLVLIVALAGRKWRGVWRNHPATLWLVCWILGGIVVMSLVPSKRVDRIFPVIPAASLCLGALFPMFQKFSWLRSRLLSGILVLTVLSYTIYTASIVHTAYRDGLQRLVIFGKTVHTLCAANHWEYAIVEGRDEGMLMYANKMSFGRVKAIAEQLKKGKIQIAVVDSQNVQKLAALTGKLQSILEVAHPTDKDYSYYLVRLAASKPTDAKVHFKSSTNHILGAGHNPITCPYCSVKPRDF